MVLVPSSLGEKTMWKRIFGAALFVWMAAATFGSTKDMLSHQGVRQATEIAAIVVCAALALIGLIMAVAPAKPLPPDDKDAGQNLPPASS